MNVRRTLTLLAVSVLALQACTNPVPPLGESQVLKAIASSPDASKCTNVQVSKKQKLDPDAQGQQRAQLSFSADCRAAAAPANAAPIKIAGDIRFTHHYSRSFWAGVNEWKIDGIDWIGAPLGSQQHVPSGEFSDAPQCNALIARWQAQVLPCVQSVDSPRAALLAQRIEEHKNMLRLRADAPNRNAALLSMDQACFDYWRQMHRQMDHPPAVSACRLPD